MKYSNHLKMGYLQTIHKGKDVVSSLNSSEFNDFLNYLDRLSSRVGTIPPGYEHRADKIADLFYGSPTLDWLVCWANNVSDPFQQLNEGDRIRIVDF